MDSSTHYTPMDPLKISTGVSGFLSPAIEIIQILTEYQTTVASAPSDVQTLLTEVSSLTKALQQLMNFLKKPEHTVDFHETSVLCSVVTICDTKIKNLHSKLDKFRLSGDRWKWPFEKKECLDITQTLHHCAETIHLSFTISNGELLSRTSQQLTTDLADRKQHYDSLFGLLKEIPPELQVLQNSISEVLHFVPTIDSLASDIQQVKNAVLQLQHHNNTTRLSSIQKWLSPLEPQKRHHDIQSIRISNTGEWILETGAYKVWTNQASSTSGTLQDRILSFYGMPGAGKTFIASMMIDHLSTQIVGATTSAGPRNPRTGIAYIYCDYRDQKNQNITNIIGSLTNQLLESLPDHHQLDDIYKEIKLEEEMKRKQPGPNFTMRMLKLVLKMFDHTFICIDAIDELETGTQSSFLKTVREIFNETNNSSGSFSLCFTARPHVKDMVTEILGENHQSVTITANDDDIQKYILHQLETDPHPKLINDDLKEQLLTKIPINARGMFLLSALQIQVVLQELTIKKRKDAIGKLPTDLYGAFRTSLERICTSQGPARDLGMKVLMWVHLARRQLHIEEILHILAVEDNATDLDKENIPLVETILHCCNGLVILDKETSGVRLVHYSLQEFFKLHSSEYFPDGHKEIAHTCLTYLNFTPLLVHCETKIELEQLLRSYHLLEYSASQWGHHAAQQFDTILESLALRCLALVEPTATVQYCFWAEHVLYQDIDTSYREWESRNSWGVWDWDLFRTNTAGMAFLVSVAFGLEKIVQYILSASTLQQPEQGHDKQTLGTKMINFRDRFDRTPLNIAVRRGHEAIAYLLLEQPDIDVNAGNPLTFAAKRGNEGIVRLLLGHSNIDVNAVYCEPYFEVKVTALTHAAESGNENIVRLLLEHPNIDINLQAPLARAAENGHENIVRLLLQQHNIDIVAGAPLARAASSGHEDIVRILLEQPNINVNASMPEFEGTALACAAEGGYEGIVRLLLEQPNIDINAGTPLAAATEFGHENIVRLLLEQENILVDLGAPLALAAGNGHENIVCLLLEQPNIDVNLDALLSCAVASGYEHIVRLLLEHPNVNVNNCLPLDKAAEGGYESIVSLLLEHPSIDVNARTVLGSTSLATAASVGHEGIVRSLLAHPGIDISATDSNGKTALSLAIKYNHLHIADILRRHSFNNADTPNPGVVGGDRKRELSFGNAGHASGAANIPSGSASKKSKT